MLTRTKQAPEGPVTSNYWDENKAVRQHVNMWSRHGQYEKWILFQPSPLCSCYKWQSSPVQPRAYPPPPPPPSCAQWTHMICQHSLCLRIPVPTLTLSDYYTYSLITRGQLLLLRFKHLFYSVFPQLFFFGGGFFSYFAPMHIPPLFVPSRPHLCLLQPLFPPTLHIPGVSGWKVQWGSRIPEGQRGLCLIPTRALYVCKSH